TAGGAGSLVEASVLSGGIGEIAAEGWVLELILLDLGAGEEGEFFEGCLGGFFERGIFRLVETVVRKDFAQQGLELGVLEGAQAGGVERFFIGDVVAGGGHGYGRR